ncbi:hypothetical protein ACFQ0B_76940 [Nonomuraea thailandensis]
MRAKAACTVVAAAGAVASVSAGMLTVRSKVWPAVTESGALSPTVIEVFVNGDPLQV